MNETENNPSAQESAPSAPEARPAEYIADVSFDELGISEPIRRAINERGYTNPTPVQAKAFRPVVDGKDLIVRSKTGTGKTAAFGLPLLEKIPAGERQVKALILCPTRELAIQVAAEIADLGKYKDLKVATIYGGASMKTQEDALEYGSAIVVGTPGRVFDHIRRGNLKLEACTHAVLDEADEMLNQGFYEEVTRILDYLPKGRQVLLFSATVPTEIQNLIAKYTTNAETLLLSGDVFTVDHIHHVRFEISDQFPKPRNLIYVLEKEEPENAIIFCNTRDDTTLVNAVLNRNGFDSEVLNGDLPQKERERVMAKIRKGEVAFMVATDIAARGIDISHLGHVINYSLPEDPAVYLHRVGRTGRIGKKGVAINLTSGRELTTLTTLEKKFSIKFEQRKMPSPEEAAQRYTERHVKEIRDAMGGTLYEGMLPLAGQLKGRTDSDDLMAFLLKYFFQHHRMEKAQAAAGGAVEAPAPTYSEPRYEERPRGRDRGTRERGGRERERGRDRERSGDREPRRERKPREERPAEVAASGAPVTAEGAPAAGPASSEVAGARAPEGERRPRRERKPLPPAEEIPGSTRLWVNLGKSDQLDPAGVTTALEAAGAPGGKVTKVDLRGTYAYVYVTDADVGAFEALSGKPHGEKALKLERAKK